MDFRNTKIRIKSPDHCNAFREAVKKAGGIDRICRPVDFITHLYVDENLYITWTGSDDEDCFVEQDYKEITYPEPQQGHPHAEAMAQYAADAKTTDKPWELWEVKYEKEWGEFTGNPSWFPGFEYRRKPKTKLIHGVEVLYISFTPECGDNYYVPCITSSQLFFATTMANEASNFMHIKHGMAYPFSEEGKQAAILHAKAMLGIAPGQGK